MVLHHHRDENRKRMGGEEGKKREKKNLVLKKKCGFIMFGSWGHLHIDPALFRDIGYVVACVHAILDFKYPMKCYWHASVKPSCPP